MVRSNLVVIILTSGVLFLWSHFARCEATGVESVDPATSDRINRSVQEMMSQIPADLSQHGPTAWLRYFYDDPHFLMAADGNLQFDGIASAQHFLSGFAANIAHLELSWTDVKVDPLSATMASVAAGYSEVLTDTLGHAKRPRGYFTGLVVHTPAGWKLRSAHWSTLPPRT